MPSVTSGNVQPAGYLFHDPETVYNPPRADRPPPSIGRQLLNDVAWVVGVLGGIAAAIIVSGYL